MNTAASQPTDPVYQDNQKIEQFLSSFIADLNTHHIQFETNTARKELVELYEPFAEGNTDKIMHMSALAAKAYFVRQAIGTFIKGLESQFPTRLAFNASVNSNIIHVWAEIPDDDEKAEFFIYDVEAKVNAHYYQYGVYLDVMIVEACDQIDIPSNYKTFK